MADIIGGCKTPASTNQQPPAPLHTHLGVTLGSMELKFCDVDIDSALHYAGQTTSLNWILCQLLQSKHEMSSRRRMLVSLDQNLLFFVLPAFRFRAEEQMHAFIFLQCSTNCCILLVILIIST